MTKLTILNQYKRNVQHIIKIHQTAVDDFQKLNKPEYTEYQKTSEQALAKDQYHLQLLNEIIALVIMAKEHNFCKGCKQCYGNTEFMKQRILEQVQAPETYICAHCHKTINQEVEPLIFKCNIDEQAERFYHRKCDDQINGIK